MNQPRLSVEISLPMRWQVLDAPLDTSLAQGNRLLLHTLNAMESSHPDTTSDRLLERIEAKLDLTLHWLARSLHANSPMPASRLLRLDTEGLAWQEESASKRGDWLRTTLYPSSAIQAPLVLAAECVSSQGGWTYARILDLGSEGQEEWTQWIFRMHRRMIQAAKR